MGKSEPLLTKVFEGSTQMVNLFFVNDKETVMALVEWENGKIHLGLG